MQRVSALSCLSSPISVPSPWLCPALVFCHAAHRHGTACRLLTAWNGWHHSRRAAHTRDGQGVVAGVMPALHSPPVTARCAASGTHHCALTLLPNVNPVLQVHAGVVLRGGMRQARVAVPQAAVSCASGSCGMQLMHHAWAAATTSA